MVDILSYIYGVLTVLGTLVLLKIIDIILEQLLNKTIFTRIWTLLSKNLKKFLTRFKPIKTYFQFRVQFEPCEINTIKESIVRLFSSISEKYPELVGFSSIMWDDDNIACSVNVNYNEREFRMNICIDTEYHDFDPEEELLRPYKKGTFVFSDSVAFSIEVVFPFHMLDQTLLALSAFTSLLKEGLTEHFSITKFSKGMFTIAPIKGDFTIDHWVKEKQFDVSLLLKAREKVLVNLYPEKAEIIFPTLQIDDKASEYLKGTLLNYYL